MSWLWLEVLKSGLAQGSFIALVAMAFAWVYRPTRVFHVAVAVPFLLGGYTAVHLHSRAGLSLAPCCMGAVAVGIVASVAVYTAVYRRLQSREASNSLRLIASLGVYFLCCGTASLLFGTEIENPAVGAAWSVDMSGVIITSTDCRYAGTTVLAAAGLSVLLRSTRMGRGVPALASNPMLFESLGHSGLSVALLAATVSGALAGLAGGYEALRNGIDPYAGLPVAIAAAVAAILGGRSLLWGPIVASLALGVAKSTTTQIASDRWADSVVYGLLLLIAVVRPARLFAPALGEERP